MTVPVETASDDGKTGHAQVPTEIRTWWCAKTSDKGEWLAVDLGRICRVNAIQVNFAEHEPTKEKKTA